VPDAYFPYGVVRAPGEPPRPAIRVGAGAAALAALELDVAPAVLEAPDLNPLLALGAAGWADLHEQVAAAVRAGRHERASLPLSELETLLPIAAGDYVDFYASLSHATNVGRIFRPGAEPLLPNWRHLPVGYHGRAGTVVVSGTAVRRPCGQLSPAEPGGAPAFGPEPRLDLELELGWVTGDGPPRGELIDAGRAGDHIFGLVLVNDWSARAIQRWEYQPLGPFLGKSFATSISAWIVPYAAFAGARVPGPVQEPAPLPHLRVHEPRALDIDLAIELNEVVISRSNARHLYWSPEQMLAHATTNGATVRAGDLFASGTVSGPEPGSYGSLLEVSWDGRDPIDVGGESRTFLQDGDTVVLRGRAGSGVELGEVAGTVQPVRAAR